MGFNLPQFSFSSRLFLMAAVLFITLFGWIFSRRQNHSFHMGGHLSKAKSYWLCFAILFWFFVIPIFSMEPCIPKHWRTIFALFSVNIWLRGLIELFMLYRLKNWKPIYGISHDLFTLLLLIGLVIGLEASETHSSWWGMATLTYCFLVLSIVLETVYATVFRKLVGDRTTGDKAVWFASSEDKFRRINYWTGLMNKPLYLFLVLLLGGTLGVFQ